MMMTDLEFGISRRLLTGAKQEARHAESLGYASLIVWLNPLHDPRRPTRVPEGDIL